MVVLSNVYYPKFESRSPHLSEIFAIIFSQYSVKLNVAVDLKSFGLIFCLQNI